MPFAGPAPSPETWGAAPPGLWQSGVPAGWFSQDSGFSTIAESSFQSSWWRTLTSYEDTVLALEKRLPSYVPALNIGWTQCPREGPAFVLDGFL